MRRNDGNGEKERQEEGPPERAGRGVAHIQATFNNTIITITDPDGNTLAWSSAGAKGFKGSRESTPFAATVAAEEVAKKAMDSGVNTVTVHIKGPGSGREAALRSCRPPG